MIYTPTQINLILQRMPVTMTEQDLRSIVRQLQGELELLKSPAVPKPTSNAPYPLVLYFADEVKRDRMMRQMEQNEPLMEVVAL